MSVTLDFSQAQPITPTAQNVSNTFVTPHTNQTVSPGQRVSVNGQTGTITGQHPDTGKAIVQWDGQDQNSAQNSPVSLDFSKAQPIQPIGVQGTISANPQPAKGDLAGRLAAWSQNVQEDLKNGTDLTGIGAVLKKMGAHGLYAGNSQAVGNYFGSIPLGILQAVKGVAEQSQPGKFLKGTGDIAGGALQVATIPSAFVAPEAGETAGSLVQGTGSAIKSPLSSSEAREAAEQAATEAENAAKVVQPVLRKKILDVLTDTANEIGVKPPDPNASIRDAATDIGSAALRKAQTEIYQKLDAVSGGRFQRFADQLKATEKALSEDTGIDETQTAKLEQRKSDLEKSIQQVKDDAVQAGVNPDSIKKADALWKQGKALQKYGEAVRVSTSGRALTPAESETAEELEAVSPTAYFKRVNRLYDKGTLQNAVGKDRAEAILDHAAEAVNNSKTAKAAAQTATDKAAELAARQKTVRNRRIGTAVAATAGSAAMRSHILRDAVSGIL